MARCSSLALIVGSFFEPIQESGTHQEPLAKDGLYKRLYELQPAEA